MLHFVDFLRTQFLTYPKVRDANCKVQICEYGLNIISPVDKDFSIYFIQHSLTHFEAKLEVLFQHKIYGECRDLLSNTDCLVEKAEKGFMCLLSAEDIIYSTQEELIFEYIIRPFLDSSVLESFLYNGFEFWIDKTNGIQIARLFLSDTYKLTLRSQGWKQLKGKAVFSDEELLPQIIKEIKKQKEIKISDIQRKFYLGYHRALKLLEKAKRSL